MDPVLHESLVAATMVCVVIAGVGIYRTVRYAPPLERTRWIPVAIILVTVIFGFPFVMGPVSALFHLSERASLAIVYGFFALGMGSAAALGLRLLRRM
jgi:hypothetical protein